MAMLLDIIHELMIFLRGPGTLLEALLVTTRRPPHWWLRTGYDKCQKVAREDLPPPWCVGSGYVVFQMAGYQSIAHLYIKASSLFPKGNIDRLNQIHWEENSDMSFSPCKIACAWFLERDKGLGCAHIKTYGHWFCWLDKRTLGCWLFRWAR
jgi:hypothetical protein